MTKVESADLLAAILSSLGKLRLSIGKKGCMIRTWTKEYFRFSLHANLESDLQHTQTLK